MAYLIKTTYIARRGHPTEKEGHKKVWYEGKCGCELSLKEFMEIRPNDVYKSKSGATRNMRQWDKWDEEHPRTHYDIKREVIKAE